MFDKVKAMLTLFCIGALGGLIVVLLYSSYGLKFPSEYAILQILIGGVWSCVWAKVTGFYDLNIRGQG